MSLLINETHDPQLRSSVESAHVPQGDFPIQNLPFAVLRRRDGVEPARVGVAIGDQILDLTACRRAGLFEGAAERAATACAADSLNALMSLGREYWAQLRLRVS